MDSFVHRSLAALDPSAQYTPSLATWVLFHTLRIMLHFTLAGFELELYALHEYHYIYWQVHHPAAFSRFTNVVKRISYLTVFSIYRYLYECLFRWQASNLNRLENMFQVHQDLQSVHRLSTVNSVILLSIFVFVLCRRAAAERSKQQEKRQEEQEEDESALQRPAARASLPQPVWRISQGT